MLPLKMMIKYFIFIFLLNLQYPLLILEIQHILIWSSSKSHKWLVAIVLDNIGLNYYDWLKTTMVTLLGLGIETLAR